MSAHAKDGIKGKSGKKVKVKYVTVRPRVPQENLSTSYRGRVEGKPIEVSEVSKAEKIAESLRNPTEEMHQRFRDYIANH